MTLLLHGSTLVDGTGADPRKDQTIAIDGERIASISRRTKSARNGDKAIDLAGCTLLPGLIDAHAHLGLVFDFQGDPGFTSASEIAAKTFRNAELCVEAGFTTVRDMCGVDGGIVNAIEQGLIKGPRVYPSGPAIAQTGGHGHLTGPFCDINQPLAIPGLVQLLALCDSADEVRKAARQNFRRGATQLKVFISGGVVSKTDRIEDTQLTIEEIRAAVIEAKARETYVAAHAHNNESIRNGLEAGVECFEHGTMLDEATAAAMKKRGAALDPTLAVANLFSTKWRDWGVDETIAKRALHFESKMADAVRIAAKAKLLIGSGSDILGAEQNRRGLEIVLKAKILDPMQAIVCATLNNARIMHLDHALGSIEEGKLADVIAVRGDPLAHPEILDDLNRVALVIRGGKILKDLLGT